MIVGFQKSPPPILVLSNLPFHLVSVKNELLPFRRHFMHFPNSFQICPYLRNLKLNVVDNLDKVGQALQSNPQITLDKVTLAYGEDQPSVEQSLTTFLQVSSKYFMCVCMCVWGLWRAL